MRLLLSLTGRLGGLLLVVLWSSSVLAQGLPGFTPDLQEALQQAQRRSLDSVLPGESVPLEGAIDPTAYTVGPGDVFAVSVGTALPTQLSLTVTADGLLVVPSAGSFDVSGRTLAEARSLVLAGIRRTFRNVEANVALTRPRQFYVHVAGSVPQPGRHVVAPIARVEDALTAAMDGTSPVLVLKELRRAAALADEPTFLPALRSIEVQRRDGTTEHVDLWRYYTSGDLRFNPYVRDGDVLRVGSFRDDLAAVTVQGEVPNPGSYDYREGDTVNDLLFIANGSGDFSRLGEVRLVRRDSREALPLSTADLASGRAESLLLSPGDKIIVVPSRRDAGVARANGYVVYPGTYPIQTGETTLADLVEMAGGLREDALLRGAYIERLGSLRSATYEPDQIRPFREIPLEAGVNPQLIETALQTEVSALAGNSDLSFSGQQFYARELLRPQRLSVDLAAALRGEGPAIPLRDGDRLVVPRDPDAIVVVGQVERPGFIPYRPGLDAADYIELAGGLGATASEVFVREASTGRIRPATDAALGSGDYVFVDRTGVGTSPDVQAIVLQEEGLALQERNLELQRRTPYVQIALTAITTAATVITILLTRP